MSGWNDRRQRLWDVVVGIVAAGVLVAEAAAQSTGSPVPLVAAAAVGLAVGARRRAPLAALVVASAGLVALAGFFTDGLFIYANLVSVYSVGAYATRARAVVGLIIGLVSVVAYWVIVPAPTVAWLPGVVVAGWTLAWVAGMTDAQRRRSAADAARRALDAQQRRESELAAAVAEERDRITREVHDSLGHSLNVMVLNAGAARRTLERDPDAGAKALSTVEAVGRKALDELDHVLGVLGSDPTRRPTPGIADVDDLAGTFSAAGVPVVVRVAGTRRRLAAPVDAAAYRVVQEALTNVAKHAFGESAHVDITYEPTAVRLEVTNSGKTFAADVTPPLGRGLTGIRHRIVSLGGSADVQPIPEGGWSVRCSIPTAR